MRTSHIVSATSALLVFLVVVDFLAGSRTPGVRADSAAPKVADSSIPDYSTTIQPLITKYCATCHSGTTPSGDIDLTRYHSTSDVLARGDVWQKVLDNVQSSHMPLQGAPAPTADERAAIVNWVQSALTSGSCDMHDPGRVTLHRLNREEYDNTVDDLLDVTIRPATDFPSDDVGYGFDNIGDVLSMSPLLLEQYLDAAEKLAKDAILAPENLDKTARFFPHDFDAINDAAVSLTPEGNAILFSEGSYGVTYEFPVTGEYALRVLAYGEQAGPDACRMGVLLDGVQRQGFSVPDVIGKPGAYSVIVNVPAGRHEVDASFLNDYYNGSDPDPKNRDRNLVINRIAIEGPLTMPVQITPSEALLLPKRPASRAQFDSCARYDLAKIATRAYRRPVTNGEVNRLMELFDETKSGGASFEKSMQVSLEAILLSPNFLFRVELDPAGVSGAHSISDYELASRLSYFIWSTMPDDTLFQLASENRLHDPDVLHAQVIRMIQSPKAQALADNFAAQWLELRKLDNVAPDVKQFPDFDNSLREDMRTEAEMYFQNIVTNNRSLLEFIDSDYTFLNEELAEHYGIPNVHGSDFRMVHLTDRNRGGVLTMASTLTITSNPTRTSPVKRGRWVLEQLLGTPPPPPPPGVPPLDGPANVPVVGTLRQRMIQHRADPACAACHLKMDPLGFGLENFNAVGQWRTTDAGQPIDASGTLPDGSTFNGPAELKGVLMQQKDQFVRAFADKILTYAMGRGTEPSDRCYIDDIAKKTKDSGYKFWALMDAVVDSPPFRQRQAQKVGGAANVS